MSICGMECANTWNGEGDVDAGLRGDQDFVCVHVEMPPGHPGGKGGVCLVTHIWKLSTYKCLKPGDLTETAKGVWIEKRRGQRAGLWSMPTLRVLEEQWSQQRRLETGLPESSWARGGGETGREAGGQASPTCSGCGRSM